MGVGVNVLLGVGVKVIVGVFVGEGVLVSVGVLVKDGVFVAVGAFATMVGISILADTVVDVLVAVIVGVTESTD